MHGAFVTTKNSKNNKLKQRKSVVERKQKQPGPRSVWFKGRDQACERDGEESQARRNLTASTILTVKLRSDVCDAQRTVYCCGVEMKKGYRCQLDGLCISPGGRWRGVTTGVRTSHPRAGNELNAGWEGHERNRREE